MHPKPSPLSRTTALGALASLALSALAAGSPAHAATPGTIRYATVQKCKDKGGSKEPCGPWRLFLRGGRTVKLPDARVTPLDAKGKARKNQAAPIAISGDGTTVAYFRKRDDRLVVRRLSGEVRALDHRPPEGAGMDLVRLYLSHDGGRLAVEVGDESDTRPTLVYDVSTDAGPGRLPGALVFHGFSGDGATTLGARVGGDHITRLMTFPAEGETLDAAPPAAVADNPPYALAADGRTIAFIGDSDGEPVLRRYDLESGARTPGVSVKLRDEDLVEVLAWTGDTQVTAHVSRPLDGRRTAVRVLEIDTGTGRTGVRDSYTIGADVFGYAVRGG